MRLLNITLSVLIVMLSTSCVINGYTDERFEEHVSSDYIENYDVWYVDYHATQGADEIPFMQLAFTLSFENGRMYANNNISGIGFEGEGYGVSVGRYSFDRGNLVSNHDLDGVDYFQVKKVLNSANEIELYHEATNTSYFLVGYHIDEFDYDKLFYENIEYLLQEFEIWNKYYTSLEGARNIFDYENYLGFTSENNNTFYSSKSKVGTNIANVYWNYEGDYEIFDIDGFQNLKLLTLHYDSVNVESFELTVVNDTIVELFHINSKTTYRFEGNYFIRYLKDGKPKNKSKKERKRTKIKRQKVKRF